MWKHVLTKLLIILLNMGEYLGDFEPGAHHSESTKDGKTKSEHFKAYWNMQSPIKSHKICRCWNNLIGGYDSIC